MDEIVRGLSKTNAAPVKGAWLTLFVVTTVGAIAQADRQILSVLIVPIQKELHVSDTAMGMLTGFAFAIFYICGGIPIARLADRSNRRNIIAAAIALWSVCTALCGMVGSYWQMLLARTGVAIGEASERPATYSILCDLFPAHKRGTAMGVLVVGASIGLFLGTFTGGVVSDLYGWRAAFFVLAVPGLLLSLFILLKIPEPIRGLADGVGTKVTSLTTLRWTSVVAYLARLRSFQAVTTGQSLHALTSYAILGWTAVFLMRIHGLSASEVGLYMGLSMATSMAMGNFFGGFIADVLSRRSFNWYLFIPTLACFLALPFGAAFLLIDSFAMMLVCFNIFVFFLAWVTPVAKTVVVNVARPDMRAFGSAIENLVYNLIGMGGGPLVVGLLNDRLGEVVGDQAVRYSLVATMVSLLLAGFAFLYGARFVAADMARARE